MQPQVFCLGPIHLELIYRVERLPEILEEVEAGLLPGAEQLLSREAEARLQGLLFRFGQPVGRLVGGQAANTAYALSRLGVAAALAGRLGVVADALSLRNDLAAVNLEYVTQAGASNRVYILLDQEDEHTILTASSAPEELSPDDLPWEALRQAKFLHLSPCASPELLSLAEQLARRFTVAPRLLFDPGDLCARHGHAALEPLFDQVETLLVNESEWASLGGNLHLHPVWGPPIILIKRGPLGVRLLTPVRYLDIPASFEGHPVETRDAGDVFAAGYITGLLLRLNLPQAVRLAEYAAAYKLGGAGRASYPDTRVLERILARLK